MSEVDPSASATPDVPSTADGIAKDKAMSQLLAVGDDINDFIEENPITEISESMDDLDHAIRRAEEMRSLYRNICKELMVIHQENGADVEDYDKNMNLIKKYILSGKNSRKLLRDIEHSGMQMENKKKVEAFSFVLKDINIELSVLEKEFKVTDDDLSEESELMKRGKELPGVEKKMKTLSEKFPAMLSYVSEDKMYVKDLTDTKTRYETLVSTKDSYLKKVKRMMQEKELDKEDAFKIAKLNVKLPKYKGYDSAMDIFTFKSTFEKLHSRSTPKRVMPDVLKNNFLDETALSLVKSLDDIDAIWLRLTSAFGDPKIMLNRKFDEIKNINVSSSTKDPEKVVDSLHRVINLMKDLMKLSEDHKIEDDLYHGNGLERICKVVGERRVTKWLSETCDSKMSNKESWDSILQFLEKESTIQQQKIKLLGKDVMSKDKNILKDQTKRNLTAHHTDEMKMAKGGSHDGGLICSICGEAGHVATIGPSYKKIIQYFACKKFVKMTPAERFNVVKNKGLCYQCLLPGADARKGKHSEGKCQRDFVCKHESHAKYKRKKHVLLCEEHKTTPENHGLLEEYKKRCILKEKIIELPSYSKEIKLVFHAGIVDPVQAFATENEVTNNAIYMLQKINVDGNIYNIFFDNGCGDFVSRLDAIRSIGSRAIVACPGPLLLEGVGGIITEVPHGAYSVKLPLHNGDDAFFTGVCMDKVTGKFPDYPINGEVENDIKEAYSLAGGSVADLPKLPSFAGGETDFLIGIKYLRYHPTMIFKMPSGLAIYESMFKNSEGGRGVVGGPHEVFTNIEKKFHMSSNHLHTFLCNQTKLYRMGYQINPDVSLLGFKDWRSNTDLPELPGDVQITESHVSYEKRFDIGERTGSEITYRCPRCRDCQTCKDCVRTEAVSIKEEIEEDLIVRSLKVDVENRCCTAALPFIHDPAILAPNKSKAMRTYTQQLKKLSHNSKDKTDVLKSEQKLQDLGYVDYVKNLSSAQQKMLRESEHQNHIAWRLMWKVLSNSTPCRLVFDASQPTGSGYSLNDVLAKGTNNMNKLQEILIRWSIHRVGFHTDIQKMYNCVKLREEDWCFQRYLWQEDLDPNVIPEEKVIKTVIYGVVSSGNLAEHSIRETARISSVDYPEVNEIVQKDIYVDDCVSGEVNERSAEERADQLEHVLNKGGFTLKGMAFSGKKPPESMSQDGESIPVFGIKWYTLEDEISLNLGDMVFSKKQRGRKVDTEIHKVVPEQLTRRMCQGKVAEVFDILGKFTPITAAMKMDLHELVTRKLKWDDVIPDELRPIWDSHFMMMQEMKNIRYKRVIVPVDAINLNLETLDFGDASPSILCVAIYARFRRKNGEYSCQQVLARSRLIPDTLTQPRAELYAAVVNAHTGEIVRRSFHKYHQRAYKLTDSQIALHWISHDDKPLKQWVRNRVLEIRRFTKTDTWWYVASKDMIADIGTRKGCTLKDVDRYSDWMNGYEYMLKHASLFPFKSIKDISLQQEHIEEIKIEKSYPHSFSHYLGDNYTGDANSKNIPGKVIERYQFSKYILDPNRYNFRKVIRIMGYVMKFNKSIRGWVTRTKNGEVRNTSKDTNELPLTTEDIGDAERYYFWKATNEIKQFYRKEAYERYSKECDGILKFSGRILPSGEIEAVSRLTDAMKDLMPTSFCVPLIDKHSPIAYSITSDYHWNNATVKHSGIETTVRYIMKYVHIIQGREIMKKIKKSCERCRYLEKMTIDISMGPVSEYNLKIAPAFYVTQADLTGPFKSYSNINKRATTKIWLVVFCCCTTGTTSIKVMENYNSLAFIHAFIRLSCEVGYPKKLLIDSGSQLVSSCENMKIDFQDVKSRLYHDVCVECEVCPVGGHNMNGKVERKIQEIKKSMEKSIHNERLSILQWETVVAAIANRINDLPLALGNLTSDFECMDLLTPNRLRLGRNNDRSPTGWLSTSNDAAKIIEANKAIFDSWFECWLIAHVPKLTFQPKWFRISEHIKSGDIVLFLKHESTLSSTYQYGMVTEVEESKDGIIRKVLVKYRNHYEDFNRETYRSVRRLVMIHRFEELDILQELTDACRFADQRFKDQLNVSSTSGAQEETE